MRIYGYGIWRSMVIAFRNFMRKPITMQYPHEKWELPERSRWAVAQHFDENGNHKCTACLACERACPDFVIKIDVTTGEDRSKHIDRFHYELGACMMCGLCVEACNFGALYMSHEYELAQCDFSKLEVDLLFDTPAASPKRKAAEGAAAKPAAERPAKPAAAEVEPDAPAAPAEPAPTADTPAPAAETPAAPAPATESASEEGGADV